MYLMGINSQIRWYCSLFGKTLAFYAKVAFIFPVNQWCRLSEVSYIETDPIREASSVLWPNYPWLSQNLVENLFLLHFEKQIHSFNVSNLTCSLLTHSKFIKDHEWLWIYLYYLHHSCSVPFQCLLVAFSLSAPKWVNWLLYNALWIWLGL